FAARSAGPAGKGLSTRAGSAISRRRSAARAPPRLVSGSARLEKGPGPGAPDVEDPDLRSSGRQEREERIDHAPAGQPEECHPARGFVLGARAPLEQDEPFRADPPRHHGGDRIRGQTEGSLQTALSLDGE